MRSAAIHPLKAYAVKNICEIALEYPVIKRLIVFGSAATEHCTENSDLDICVDTDANDNDRTLIDAYTRMSEACNYDCDILTYRKLGSRLRTEVDATGVLVYEAAKN